jgi:DNA-binding NarL/FixJ family response regulator
MSAISKSQIATYEYKVTAPERELLQLIVDGYTIMEMEHSLCMSPQVIELHLKTLFKKFKVESLLQLVRLALENRIVD